MKKHLASLFLTLLFTACTTTEFHDFMTKGEALGWQFAGAYETVNAATGGALTTTLLNSALVATHNTPDEAIVDQLGKQADAAVAKQVKAVADKVAAAY